jgi:dolichyl-phosphate beta-glucosyltransferase
MACFARSEAPGVINMSDSQEKTCLVIPCHDEAARLDMGRFLSSPESYLLLFVNDGSTDRTAEVVRQHLGGRVHLLDLSPNRGKAEAVRSGMLHAVRTPPLSDAVWFGYWDADLATPLSEVQSLLRFSRQLDDRVDSIWGSRVYRLGSVIERKLIRHLANRCFATTAGLLLNTRSYDSQCGAKLFRREVVAAAFGAPFVSRWLFDIELMFRLRDATVVECPLRQWRDVPGKRSRFAMIALRGVPDLLRIRARYGRLK